MSSRLIVNSIRHTGASADAITLDNSGNATFPANVTCSGTATGFGGGKLLQVVQTFKTDAFSRSSTSFGDITGMSVSITPASSSNKILIVCHLSVGTNGNGYVGFRLLRGSTAIREWWTYSLDSNWSPLQGPGKHIDTPSTTSAVTYKFQIWVSGGTAAYFMWNYQGPTGTNALRQAEVYAMEQSA